MPAILSKLTVLCLFSYFVVYFLKSKLILFYDRVVYYYIRIILILRLYHIYIYIYIYCIYILYIYMYIYILFSRLGL